MSSSMAATPSGRTMSAAARRLTERGIHYVDVGTSGGVGASSRGYCMMIGGDQGGGRPLDPIFSALAPGIGDIPRTGGREGRDRASSRATFMPARSAPGISSR
jgi:6-phosphogluconate dehydrogenase (decarboxylating)